MRKFFAKATAIAVAATLTATPLTAVAASGSASGSSPNQSSSSTSSSDSSHHSSKGGGSSTSTSSAKSTASVVTGSGVISSSVGGSYTVTVVNGTAVVTPKAEVNVALGLSSGEVATVVACDSRAGAAAKKSLSDAAAAFGVGMGPMFDFSAMATGAKGSRTIGTFTKDIAITAGIPASMRMEGVEYAMIRVIPGGQVDILVDVDADPNTITFNTNASGVYMLVAAPAGYFAVLTSASAN